MNKIHKIILSILLLVSLVACSEKYQNSMHEELETVQPTPAETTTAPTEVSESNLDVEHVEVEEDADDYVWDTSTEIPIELDGAKITAQDNGVQVDGNQAVIINSGTYRLSGNLSDGQIIVDTDGDGIVRLILDGVEITNQNGPAIYIRDADKVMVVLAEGSQNSLTDGEAYILDADSDEPNATLFSKSDLILYGSGKLSVDANYNDSIASKDGLLINGTKINITAVDDGIRGKDYVVIRAADLNIEAGGDGVKSDEEEDASKGFITIESGSLTISAGSDAIAAESDITILDGNFDLTSGEGSSARVDDSTSTKGIKGNNSLTISNGIFTINAADDALHSNNAITINGGTFEIATGDDGMHADTTLTINGGVISISQSYEGLESAAITINAGEITLNASDDGINVAGGADASGMNPGMPAPGEKRQRPGGGGPGMDMFAASGNYLLTINGGSILVNADGDGIDSNGSITISDGLVIVNGPTESMNGALDYMGTFNISGGTLIAVGSAGMAQAPSTSSSQNALIAFFSSAVRAGTTLSLQNNTSEAIFTFAPSKNIQSLVFSSPQLSQDVTYKLLLGNKELSSFSLSGVVTQLGSGGGMFRR